MFVPMLMRGVFQIRVMALPTDPGSQPRAIVDQINQATGNCLVHSDRSALAAVERIPLISLIETERSPNANM